MHIENVKKLRNWARKLPTDEKFDLSQWSRCYLGKYILQNRDTIPKKIAKRIHLGILGGEYILAKKRNKKTGELLIDELANHFGIPVESDLLNVLQGLSGKNYSAVEVQNGNTQHLLDCIEIVMRTGKNEH